MSLFYVVPQCKYLVSQQKCIIGCLYGAPKLSHMTIAYFVGSHREFIVYCTVACIFFFFYQNISISSNIMLKNADI